MIYSVR